MTIPCPVILPPNIPLGGTPKSLYLATTRRHRLLCTGFWKGITISQFLTPELGSFEEAQALLSAIIASSDDAIISKDLKGIVRSWNPSAQRIFGYTAEEMIGKPITVLFPPDRLEEESRILERLQRGERVDHFETIRMRKDGTPVAVSVTISPIHDKNGKIVGASKVARDIGQSTELEGRFKAIIASSDDAIVSKDLNGIVKSWNQSAERMFGYTAEEMIGKPLLFYFPPIAWMRNPRFSSSFVADSASITSKPSAFARTAVSWMFQSPFPP